MKNWTCEHCGAKINEIEFDYDLHALEVISSDGNVLGQIHHGDIDAMVEDHDALDSGGCPICDGWEDGHGNTCTEEGWSVKSPEEIWQEVDTKMTNLAEFLEEADLGEYDPDTDTGTVRYIEDLSDVRRALYDDIEAGIDPDEDLDEFLTRHRIRFDDWTPITIDWVEIGGGLYVSRDFRYGIRAVSQSGFATSRKETWILTVRDSVKHLFLPRFSTLEKAQAYAEDIANESPLQRITLKSARLLANLSQVEAAEKLGITQPTLANWETGATRFSPAALRAMCDVYNVLPEHLRYVGDSDDQPIYRAK